MASVVAVPVGQPALPDYMTLNPWFDQPAPILGAIGIPWWVVICAGFLLLFILVNLSWIFKIKRMAAVKGYKEIQKKAGPESIMTWLFGKTQKMIIEELRYIDSVASYYNPIRITKWHLTSPMAMMHIGGYPAMMVSDDYDQSRDPVAEIALCYGCEQFNADLKDWSTKMRPKLEAAGQLQEGIDYNELAKPITSFSDYKKRGNLLLKLTYPDGIPIPVYNIFNPVKFRKYFPKGRSAGFYGGVQRQKAKGLKDEVVQKSFWERILPVAVIMVLCILFVMGAWMAPLGK